MQSQKCYCGPEFHACPLFLFLLLLKRKQIFWPVCTHQFVHDLRMYQCEVWHKYNQVINWSFWSLTKFQKQIKAFPIYVFFFRMWSACVKNANGSISKFHNLPPDLNLCIYFSGNYMTAITKVRDIDIFLGNFLFASNILIHKAKSIRSLGVFTSKWMLSSSIQDFKLFGFFIFIGCINGFYQMVKIIELISNCLLY